MMICVHCHEEVPDFNCCEMCGWSRHVLKPTRDSISFSEIGSKLLRCPRMGLPCGHFAKYFRPMRRTLDRTRRGFANCIRLASFSVGKELAGEQINTTKLNIPINRG